MRELRAQEGRRMKARYRAIADEHNVRWAGRTAQWDTSDPLNQAITAAHCLYGAAANIIAALGCHPSLGFIHTG